MSKEISDLNTDNCILVINSDIELQEYKEKLIIPEENIKTDLDDFYINCLFLMDILEDKTKKRRYYLCPNLNEIPSVCLLFYEKENEIIVVFDLLFYSVLYLWRSDTEEKLLHIPRFFLYIRICEFFGYTKILDVLSIQFNEFIYKLKKLAEDRHNNFCFDCSSENPEFASINHGVFICYQYS